jgi:hypothetical protein
MKTKGIWIVLVMVLVFVSCKTNTINTASKIQAEAIDFDFFSSRSKLKVDKKGMDFSVLMNLRIQKNQVIWINLSNTMIGKIGKCKITPDSVFVLRDYEEKEYYKGSIDDLNTRLGYSLSYSMLQNMLLGEMPLMKMDSATIVKENGELVIVQKEPLFTLENRLNSKTKKLNSLKISQNGKAEYLELLFSEYTKVNNRLIPTEMHLNSNVDNDFFNDVYDLRIRYIKNKFTSDTLTFPFKVSSKYALKTL